MSPVIRMLRIGPLTTLQDGGRPGMLRHGVSASGPMDRAAYERAGLRLGGAGATAIEFTRAGLAFTMQRGTASAAWDGGDFTARQNGVALSWPGGAILGEGDVVEITPGTAGNYGYIRFDCEVDLPLVLGSRSTNLVAGIGGLEGRPLRAGDLLALGPALPHRAAAPPTAALPAGGPFRVVWGLHADLFEPTVRERFLAEPFTVSARLDRMGVRLVDSAGVFSGGINLSLVSDAIVPGDVQILGDGAPIVLMRDHQPTGGYPRIATVATADLDRFAQLRPGSEFRFEPVSLSRAQALLQ